MLTPEDIKQVQEIATKAAQDVYKEKGTRYGVATVPAHTHNGVDTNKIPPSSITSFLPLSKSVSTGVVAVAVANGQYISVNNNYTIPLSSIYVQPAPVVTGGGVGPGGAFNGGVAPLGTIVGFFNPGLAAQIWLNVDGTSSGWHGVNLPL